MPRLSSELRNATRALMRAPVITFSAILCIALGIGATTAIASAIDRALLQPLPFRAPHELVTVYRTTPHFDTGPFSAPNYRDLAEGSDQLEHLAAVTTTTALLSLPEGGAQISANRATGNLFVMLGVQPALGRLFGLADDAPGQPPVVVLGEELWRERFGADSALLGQTISLDGVARTVIGIVPREFRVPHGGQVVRADAWIPMQFSPAELGRRRSNYLMTMGRLAPGATPRSATAELVRIFEGIVEANPELRGEGVRVLPLQSESVRTVRTPLLLLFGAVCIVLLIATTNVASLLLARGVQRQREIAIRAALGGSGWQVVRPILAETVVIVAVGLALGIGLAWIGVRTIGTLAAARIPQLAGLAIDPRVIAFAFVLSIVAGIVCALIPALRSASVDPQESLHDGRGGGMSRGSSRALSALVVAEVALSLMLLLGAGLVLKGFAQLIQRDPGFDPRPILALRATVSAQRYDDGRVVRHFVYPALEEIRAIPGVESAAAISLLPYDNWGWNFNIRYEGQPADDPTQRPLVENRVITPEFFAVTGQRLIAGRLLDHTDDERHGSPAVVVANEALARRDFPGESAVGKRFHIGDTTFATIVGVVSDIRNFGPVEAPRPEIYWAYAQSGNAGASYGMMIRVRGDDPTAVAAAVREAIQRVEREAAVTQMQPITEIIGRSTGRARFYVTLLAVFAAVAMVLAVAGIYGVMSYAVAQRSREIGIRTALGSSAGRIVRLVAAEGTTLIAIGVVIGLAGAVAATRLLQSLLYGVSPLDLSTWLLAMLVLAAAGLLASLLPALRASRIEPIVAMRD